MKIYNILGLTIICLLVIMAMLIGLDLLVWLLFVDLHIAIKVIITVILALAIIPFLFVFNRGAYRLSTGNGIIKRKGLFGGFKMELPIDAIKEIKLQWIPRVGQYYVLSDGIHKEYSFEQKDATIFVPKTKKGKKFLREVFEGRESFESLLERKTY